MRELTLNELSEVSGGDWLANFVSGATSFLSGGLAMAGISYTASGMATISASVGIGLGLAAAGAAVLIIGGIVLVAIAVNQYYAEVNVYGSC